MSTNKIYLDYNATTPVDRRVLEAMLPYFTEMYGNASSLTHVYGWDAEEAVGIAREQVAGLVGAKPQEITFTSGATEAINLALLGFCKANRPKGNHIITCATEHKAVLDTCHHLEEIGFEVTYLPVNGSGQIDLSNLEPAFTDQTILACFMYANNETGVIHPLGDISKITRKKGVVLMSDITQALGKVEFDLGKLGVDIAAFSSHKIYGPKGVGALYINGRANIKIEPLQFGGGQEKRLRPGTLNVPAIVGMGKACEILQAEQHQEIGRFSDLQTKLETKLLLENDIIINGIAAPRIPNTINLSIKNIDGGRLIRTLKDLSVSQGSACTSATIEPSHVLKAMRISDELALASIRISFGRFTTEQDLSIALEELKVASEKLKLIPS